MNHALKCSHSNNIFFRDEISVNGSELELMCNGTGSTTLEWRIMASQMYRRGVTSQGKTDTQMSYLIIGNNMFTFTRISDENDMPLVSRLLISPVYYRGLNQTRVICEDLLQIISGG